MSDLSTTVSDDRAIPGRDQRADARDARAHPIEAGKTVRLTMAQALVKYLQVQYSERDGQTRRLIPAIFGIFGHGNVSGLGQALYEYGHELPYYRPCNEQAMVHTAIGYAKTTRRLATLACTSSIGPGATNMVTGAATATINRVPVLLLPGDIYATRHQGPVLQQLEHPVSADLSVNDCFRPVSRFFDRISRPEQLLTALPEAMRVLTDPVETGAVTVALPQDIQAHAYDYPAHFFARRTWRIPRPPPEPEQIAEVVAALARAQRPLIIAGGGAVYSAASAELERFADRFGIPVAETSAGKGAITNDSPLLLGGAGVTGTPVAARFMREADLVLCIGTRLTDFTTGSHSAFHHPQVRFIHINLCGHDAAKLGALPVLADARQALRALHQAAEAAGLQPRPAYLQEIAAARAAWRRQLDVEILPAVPGEAMHQGQLLTILNQESRAGDTLVAASGSPPADVLKLWDVRGDRRCHLEFGNSCMGYEIPGGLGVRMAQSEGEVFVYVGDGTYLLNPSELVTALQERLKITVVLSNNHGYQVIRQLQMGRVGHSFGNEFRFRDEHTRRLEGDYLPIDFAANAQSMGARAWNVRTPDELRAALREARAETKACLIVVETEKHRFVPGCGVWWDVASAEATRDPVTRQLRADFERDRDRQQRFYY